MEHQIDAIINGDYGDYGKSPDEFTEHLKQQALEKANVPAEESQIDEINPDEIETGESELNQVQVGSTAPSELTVPDRSLLEPNPNAVLD